MITQEINKYKPRYTPNVTVYPGTASYYERHKMDKVEYAKYIAGLPFKVGDIVVNRYYQKNINPERDLMRVMAIEEVHHFVKDWGHSEMSGPACLTLEQDPGRPWGYQACAGLYVKWEGEIPQKWLKDADTGNQQVPTSEAT